VGLVGRVVVGREGLVGLTVEGLLVVGLVGLEVVGGRVGLDVVGRVGREVVGLVGLDVVGLVGLEVVGLVGLEVVGLVGLTVVGLFVGKVVLVVVVPGLGVHLFVQQGDLPPVQQELMEDQPVQLEKVVVQGDHPVLEEVLVALWVAELATPSQDLVEVLVALLLLLLGSQCSSKHFCTLSCTAALAC